MELKRVLMIFAIAGVTASCNTNPEREDPTLQAQQRTIDSMKMELVKQNIVDSMNEVARAGSEGNETAVVSAPRTNSSKRATTKPVYVEQETVYQHTGRQPGPVVYQEPASPAPEKKGWSAKAKGAAIGAGVGAAGGAIINKKNRSKGAVVGGILGAGAGLGTGAIIDKKKGR